MTNLTDRMRTCAAFIMASDAHERDDGTGLILRDAATLLLEASDQIELLNGPVDLGEPMEVIPAVARQMPELPGATWVAPGGPLPGLQQSGTISLRACPRCDSRANKRVHQIYRVLMLTCPTCGHQWRYPR